MRLLAIITTNNIGDKSSVYLLRITRCAANDTTLAWPTSENMNIGEAWLLEIVINFMPRCIVPPNFRPILDFLKEKVDSIIHKSSIIHKTRSKFIEIFKFYGTRQNWPSTAILNSDLVHGTVYHPTKTQADVWNPLRFRAVTSFGVAEQRMDRMVTLPIDNNPGGGVKIKSAITLDGHRVCIPLRHKYMCRIQCCWVLCYYIYKVFDKYDVRVAHKCSTKLFARSLYRRYVYMTRVTFQMLEMWVFQFHCDLIRL